MYILKKLLSAVLQPSSVFLIVIGTGLILLCFRKRHRTGRNLLLVGTAGLVLCSISPVGNAMVRPLESVYPPLLPKATEPRAHLDDGSAAPGWIVILGGGHTEDPTWAPLHQLADSARARLLEGIRLQRILRGSKLLLSGGYVHAPLLAEAAASLGVSRKQMVLGSDVLDTADEVRVLHALLKQERFVLVTSAVHMPRAIAMCRKAGMNPIPAPTDFLGNSEPWSFHSLLGLIPHAGPGVLIERALHEYLGLLWGKLRGQA